MWRNSDPLPTSSLKSPWRKLDTDGGREAEKERKRKEAAERDIAYKERRKIEKRIERIEKKMRPLEDRRKE